MTVSTEPVSSPTATAPAFSIWIVAALVVAVVGTVGSLFLSLGMGLKACPLCFYQRAFMMSAAAVLGVGLLSGLGRTGRLGLLAVPLAIAGLGVALFHVYLEMVGRLECPMGVLEFGTAPRQSAMGFSLLAVLLLADVRVNPEARRRWLVQLGGVLLGGLLAYFSCISNPPLQRPAPEAYLKLPDICRPPFTRE